MKFQAKFFITAIITFVLLCLVSGCQYSISPIEDHEPNVPEKTVETSNDPIFCYTLTEINNGVYSVTVHAKNTNQKYITGKVWGTELWSTAGNDIVPALNNIKNRLEDWHEGSLDQDIYHTGIQRTTATLPSGWYAIRGSRYESGFGVSKNGQMPPSADRYDINTIAPEKSQWYYFQVKNPQ